MNREYSTAYPTRHLNTLVNFPLSKTACASLCKCIHPIRTRHVLCCHELYLFKFYTYTRPLSQQLHPLFRLANFSLPGLYYSKNLLIDNTFLKYYTLEAHIKRNRHKIPPIFLFHLESLEIQDF